MEASEKLSLFRELDSILTTSMRHSRAFLGSPVLYITMNVCLRSKVTSKVVEYGGKLFLVYYLVATTETLKNGLCSGQFIPTFR